MPNFINPYNFVRCGNPSQRRAYVSVRRFQGLSGAITCELKTLTPIFVGGPRMGDNRRLTFFKINGEPAIPASSLKGVIRSVAEAASNSCFSIFDDRFVIHRETPEPSKRAGVMRQAAAGNWVIDEVEEIVVRGIDLRTLLGQEPSHNLPVRFDPAPRDRYGRRCASRVALPASGLCAEEGILKSYDRGIPPNLVPRGYRIVKVTGTSYDVPPEVMHGYEIVVNAVVDSVEPDPERRRWRRYLLDLDGAFVYFGPDGQQVKSFGKNRRYKWVREYSTRQLLERIHPDFLPCTSRGQLCMGCRLFGMVGQGQNQQVAGRVMFEDARIQAPYPPVQQEILRILGSPKPKYHPFYLMRDPSVQQPGAATYDDTGSRLRGRKFYWHFPAGSSYHRDPNQRLTDQNVQVELLPQDASFTFNVHFTNLEEAELGLLLYALQLDGPKGVMAHKLGMGKPIGLGSVKMAITRFKVHREADRFRAIASTVSTDPDHYVLVFQDHLGQENGGVPFSEIPNIADLARILSTAGLPASPMYPPVPRGYRPDQGFGWFMEERKRGYPQPLHGIEEIRDQGQGLQGY